eukprot:CAMPEP_0119078702 /NCGR_PEP_ID=MMETSP1178-20130426/102424_1 /TAXON_ID=33656 /ORGANISM="unid sp, Strain CCMP2000" /LENGTH=84 /DNA_ID=CAMNT_0007061163 /DNA_START=14 /DNA_END=264 /DNA_ORIENTATION=+
MVHVEAEVLTLLVPHHERVVVAEGATLTGEEQPRERQQAAPLQVIDERPHPNLIDDHAVSVHGVWPCHGQAAGLIVDELLKQRL